MTEIIISVLAIILFIKAVKLIFKLTWGVAKIIATALVVLAVPLFIVFLVFAGGLLLLIPVGLIGGAIAIVKFFV